MTPHSQVMLRALQPQDADALSSLVADPDVRLWNPMHPDDPEQWLAAMNSDDDRSTSLAVVDRLDKRLLGVASLFAIDQDQGTAEVGYRVVPAERGHGVATRTLHLLAALGFTRFGLRRIQLFHAVDNPASCTAAKRAGFPLEGTLRQSYVYGDGIAHDEHLHARLAGDVVT